MHGLIINVKYSKVVQLSAIRHSSNTNDAKKKKKKKSIMKKKIKLGCVVSSSELQVVTCFIQ